LETDFAHYQNEPGCFDLIIMLGTISNLPNLDKHLALVRKFLAKGGLFYFNAPVFPSLAAKLYGPNYWMYAPSVSNFMSIEGMNQALADAGLRVIKQRTDRQRPTLGKLLGHLKLHRFFPMFKRLGLSQSQLPLSLPIPGVIVVWATPEESSSSTGENR
jgi:predicted TPR repeat methyltransferase